MRTPGSSGSSTWATAGAEVSAVKEECDKGSSLDGWPGDFRLGPAGYGFGGHRILWLRNMLYDRESRNGLPLTFVENLKIVLRKVAYRTFSRIADHNWD